MPAFPDGTTTTQSDALGRPLTVTEQDGSIKSISYDVPARANNLGNCNDTTDEAGNKRRSCSDALGRLVEVDEPNPGAGPTNAQGSITISGQLASQSGVGAHGAVAASDQVTISGVDRSKSVIATCPRGQICDQTPETLLDTGKVSITINGHEYDYFFGQGVSGDTPATVASGLVNAIQADPARLVNASATGTGGNIVQLTAVTAGAAGNNITVTTGWTWDTVDFGTASPGFTAAANTGTLQNGIDGSAGVTVYDAGTVTLTLNTSPAFVASSPYGNTPGNSTAALVAAALVGTGSTGLNRPGSPVSATVSGSTITITYAAPGTGGDGISFTSSSQTTQTQFTFPAPSFSGSNSALGNGMNTGDVNNQPFVTLYQYDALGNLLCVEQHGNVSGTGCSASPASDASSPWRVRRFTYDSLFTPAHSSQSRVRDDHVLVRRRRQSAAKDIAIGQPDRFVNNHHQFLL